jgi:hypothetical protein
MQKDDGTQDLQQLTTPVARVTADADVRLDCAAMGGHWDRCISMSRSEIWWQCTRCGRQYKTSDNRFSL